MMEEIWKDIKGFEGHYQISNMGRVRYAETWITRIYPNGKKRTYLSRPVSLKKVCLRKYGYSVAITKGNNNNFNFPISELVASHFGKGYEDGMEITHVDGNILNNRIDNLSFKWMEDLPGEQWKPIKDFEGLYEVSNMGRFRSLSRYKMRINSNGNKVRTPVKPRLLRLNKINTGYCNVVIYKESKRYEYRAHRLVALHFCDGYKPGYVVNHLDENKSNNRADNLEWCTELYNHRYGTAIQRTVEKQQKKVAQYDKEGNLLHTYKSAKEAALKTGFNYVSLCGWCRGANKSKNDFVWKYVE